jgi:hypothetical protein
MDQFMAKLEGTKIQFTISRDVGQTWEGRDRLRWYISLKLDINNTRLEHTKFYEGDLEDALEAAWGQFGPRVSGSFTRADINFPLLASPEHAVEENI